MKTSDVYNLFFEPGEVTEIRAFGLSKSNKAWEGWAGGTGIVYGYFDNAEDFGKAAAGLEAAKAPGVYFTLNPVIPDLLARSANRLQAAKAKSASTSDKGIVCVRWLPIDLDPVRPAGISSTDAELKAAEGVANKIYKWMDTLGWAKPVVAVSGNGVHLVYRLPDIADLDAGAGNVRNALRALEEKFGTKKVNVDGTVFNPARIWKLYGTTARKGDHTESRPHRVSFVKDMERLMNNG